MLSNVFSSVSCTITEGMSRPLPSLMRSEVMTSILNRTGSKLDARYLPAQCSSMISSGQFSASQVAVHFVEERAAAARQKNFAALDRVAADDNDRLASDDNDRLASDVGQLAKQPRPTAD